MNYTEQLLSTYTNKLIEETKKGIENATVVETYIEQQKERALMEISRLEKLLPSIYVSEIAKMRESMIDELTKLSVEHLAS